MIKMFLNSKAINHLLAYEKLDLGIVKLFFNFVNKKIFMFGKTLFILKYQSLNTSI